MSSVWLLLALTCAAKAPHPCKPVLIATYPNHEWCLSGVAFKDTYPQPREIKVWCQEKPAEETEAVANE